MDTILFVSVPYTTLLNPFVQQKSTTCWGQYVVGDRHSRKKKNITFQKLLSSQKKNVNLHKPFRQKDDTEM